MPKTLRGGGNVQAANIIYKVNPIYPPEAKQARIQGTVKLNVVIGADGFVKNIELDSAIPCWRPPPCPPSKTGSTSRRYSTEIQ